MAAFCSSCGQSLTPGLKFCGHCGASAGSAGSTLIAAPGGQPHCRTCGIGTLRLEKRFRMSTPVVVIGYIFLIPSVLGVLIFVMTMFRLADTSNTSGSTMASGIAFFFAVAFFVSGLLGWLLVMKKKVLACTHCSAVVPAS